MELKQKLELRHLLVPEMRQSLNILALQHLEIRELVEKELETNPALEESRAKIKPPSYRFGEKGEEFPPIQIATKVSLQDILLRQLGMFTDSDQDYKIGEELIGNIDENGYLGVDLREVAAQYSVSLQQVENVLKLVQQFDPPGVCCRSVAECLKVQLQLSNEKDPLLYAIVDCYLEDVAKKNYTLIAKKLSLPTEAVQSLIKTILKLDPKPGRNFTQEEALHIVPDVILEQDDEDEVKITINNEDIPDLKISKDYKQMVKNKGLDAQSREFLKQKIESANELLRAISKRQATLRRIVETVVLLQADAIKTNLSHLKPLTFADVAKEINMHESTVCRAIMNKYVRTPSGVIALKDFFPSRISSSQNGEAVSSNRVKSLIKELIDREDRKHPLSDQAIAESIQKQENLSLARRTVAKYREELKILSSAYRKER